MEAFKLDTSGVVTIPRGRSGILAPDRYRWSDLSPFAQGYVEAILGHREALLKPGRAGVFAGFSDLSPEALARIIADCAASIGPHGMYEGKHTKASGRKFWGFRQSGASGCFPPLTPTLSDDGLIYFKEQA